MITKEVAKVVDDKNSPFCTQLEKVDAFIGELNAAGIHIKKAQYNICDGIHEISFISPSKICQQS